MPVIPGSKDILHTVEEAKNMAESIGYPVLIKASNGGGGRGMRRADNAEELADAFIPRSQKRRRTSGMMRYIWRSLSWSQSM